MLVPTDITIHYNDGYSAGRISGAAEHASACLMLAKLARAVEQHLTARDADKLTAWLYLEDTLADARTFLDDA